MSRSVWGIVSFVGFGMLAGCGGGSGGGGGGGGGGANPTFTVAGTVSGLSGSGLALQINGGDTRGIATDGSFAFSTQLASGSAYNVTVQTQPSAPTQICTVANATGTITTSNVTNIQVTCVTSSFTIGGTVSGLAGGTGLVLINNRDDQLAVSSNGAFTFPAPLLSGVSYDIRVLSQPYDPYQSCRVSNGTGEVTSAAVTAPSIHCATLVPRFATSIDYGAASYSQYAVDAATGQLRPRGFALVGANPIDIGATSDSRMSFVLSRGTATLHAFVRDLATGRVTEAEGSPRGTGGIADTGTPPVNGVSAVTTHPRLPYVYVANGAGSTTIAGFSYETTAGVLQQIPGSPFAAGANPVKLVIDPTGRFAYAANQDADTISAYAIDQSTGALASIGDPVATGAPTPGFPLVHPTGKFLYVPSLSGSISVYAIGATGALTSVPGSPFAIFPDITTRQLAFHPSGKYLYVTSAPTDAGSIAALAVNATSGALTMIGTPIALDWTPHTLSMDNSGRYIFITHVKQIASQGSLSELRVDPATGALTKLAGLQGIYAPYRAMLDSSGRYLYIASTFSQHMAYSFDAATGAMTPIGSHYQIAARDTPLVLASVMSEDSTPLQFESSLGYVPNSTSISAFSIDTATGGFSSQTGVAAPADLQSAQIHPSRRTLIALSGTPNPAIASYSIDPSSGALGAATGSVGLPSPTTSIALALEPSGRFAYVADQAAGLLRMFRLDASTGAVLEAGGTSLVASPKTVTVHPTGRFVYYLNDTHWGYRIIDPATGELTGGTTGLAPGTTNTAIAVHPGGRYAYIAHNIAGSGRIMPYSLLPAGGNTAGLLSPQATVLSGGTNPVSIAMDPTGRFMYVADGTTPFNVRAFAIGTTGTLTPIPSGDYSLSAQPSSVRVDYSGRFLYATLSGSSQVVTFSIDTASGALTTAPVTPAITGTSPHMLTLSEDIK